MRPLTPAYAFTPVASLAALAAAEAPEPVDLCVYVVDSEPPVAFTSGAGEQMLRVALTVADQVPRRGPLLPCRGRARALAALPFARPLFLTPTATPFHLCITQWCSFHCVTRLRFMFATDTVQSAAAIPLTIFSKDALGALGDASKGAVLTVKGAKERTPASRAHSRPSPALTLTNPPTNSGLPSTTCALESCR